MPKNKGDPEGRLLSLYKEYITVMLNRHFQHQFIDAFDESNFDTNLDFKRLNGDAYSMPYYQLFAHVVNHATYHRGQLVTMLRQAGFTNVSATDLLGVYRKN